MSKEIKDLLEKARFELPILSTNIPTRKLIGEALDLIEQQPKALDFAINCGAMGKGDDSCCGCIYWPVDGKLLCNECGTEYHLVEQQPPAGELTKRIRFLFDMPYQIVQKEPQKLSRTIGYIAPMIFDACDRLDRAESINADLLAACKAVSKSVGDFRPDGETMILIEAAIAKAVGE